MTDQYLDFKDRRFYLGTLDVSTRTVKWEVQPDPFYISFAYKSVNYKLYLFNKVLFGLPKPLGYWLWVNTNWAIQQYTKCRKRPLPSILDVPCVCPNCGWSRTVYDCLPDIDGDGSLGCPECETAIEAKG